MFSLVDSAQKWVLFEDCDLSAFFNGQSTQRYRWRVDRTFVLKKKKEKIRVSGTIPLGRRDYGRGADSATGANTVQMLRESCESGLRDNAIICLVFFFRFDSINFILFFLLFGRFLRVDTTSAVRSNYAQDKSNKITKINRSLEWW